MTENNMIDVIDSLDAILTHDFADVSPSQRAFNEATAHQAQLTKPEGSLGQLEDVAVFMASWHGKALPADFDAQALIFAGNHGICNQGVSAFPQSVTTQMVENFERGGAAINQLCKQNNAKLNVIPVDLAIPTQDFSIKPAMSADECLAAINIGVRSVDTSMGLIIVGEMGIGNTTSASALCHGLFGQTADNWTGRGTGLDDAALTHKTKIVSSSVGLHRPQCQTPLDWLCAVGGRELAAIVGAIVAARMASIPVLLDGFICSSAAAVLHAINPSLLDHALLGHVSAEPGHKHLIAILDKEPILSLNMRLGEGSGAAVALGVIRSAMACHNGMATFADAMVDTKSDG